MPASIAANVGGEQTYDGGTVAVTFTTFDGCARSSLAIVSVEDFAPAVAGWKRIGRSMLSPGATLIGNASTCGASNSADDETMLVMCSGQVPLLLIVSGRSRNRVGQSVPKSPVSAMTVAIVGLPTLADTGTATDRFSGSSLGIVSVAFATPGPVGVKVT